MAPLVSIIIPVYNSAKHVSEAIRSALNQTWKNLEIILVDDGSTDNSLSIIQSFAAENVKVFYQTNKGASAARNRGLREASGEFIQYLDADDLISPNKIEEQLNLISGSSTNIAISRTIYFSEGHTFRDPLKHDQKIEHYNDPFAFLIDMYHKTGIVKNQRGVVTVHSWLTPIELIKKAGYWNEDLNVDDDGEYFCRVVLASESIIYVPNAVNYYRKLIVKTNLSSRNDQKAMCSILVANELKYQHLKKRSGEERVDQAFAKVFMESAVAFYPEFKSLHRIAAKHVKELGGTDYIPVIGGASVELIKKIFGWKVAKYSVFVGRRVKKLYKLFLIN